MIAFHDGPTKIFRWEQRLHAPRSGPLMVAEPGRAQGVEPHLQVPRSGPPAATLSGPKAFGLPAMSLGTHRCCPRRQNSRGESGTFEGARGAGPGPGGIWFSGPRSWDGLPDRDGRGSAGEDPLPEPFGALLRKEAWSEGPRVLLQRNLTVEFSADVR